jgi:hypothetical protein
MELMPESYYFNDGTFDINLIMILQNNDVNLFIGMVMTY